MLTWAQQFLDKISRLKKFEELDAIELEKLPEGGGNDYNKDKSMLSFKYWLFEMFASEITASLALKG